MALRGTLLFPMQCRPNATFNGEQLAESDSSKFRTLVGGLFLSPSRPRRVWIEAVND